MNQCINRSLNVVKCVRGVLPVTQVAHYNDNPKNFEKKKRRRHHVNKMRKTVLLKKMLSQYEPTPHDDMMDEAIRFSEAEFRSQMLHLRGEWRKMYSELDQTVKESRDLEIRKHEADRIAFIEEIEARQAEKRAIGPPDKHIDSQIESIEEEFRRTSFVSPDLEVESFLEMSSEGKLVTPETFDDVIDTLLSEDVEGHREIVLRGKNRVAATPGFQIEFVLESSVSNSGELAE